MKSSKTILIVDDNVLSSTALSFALNCEYESETCPNSYGAVCNKLEMGADRFHAIILDADMLNSRDCFHAKGISLIDALRTKIKTDLPIVLLSFQDISGQYKQCKHFFLKRRGYYFTQQPFLLTLLTALLSEVNKCDLTEDMKCFKMLRYGIIVEHQYIHKLDSTPTDELASSWEKNRQLYAQLGEFKEELPALDKAFRGKSRENIKSSFLALLAAGSNYILKSQGN